MYRNKFGALLIGKVAAASVGVASPCRIERLPAPILLTSEFIDLVYAIQCFGGRWSPVNATHIHEGHKCHGHNKNQYSCEKNTQN